MKRYYTGIGSRETPRNVLNFMTELATKFEAANYILRSGGAPGADTAFENGVDNVNNKEIYLPWKNFGDSKSPYYEIGIDALKMAENYHPAWDRCSEAAKKLHARNCYQVLGVDLNTPSEFIICWTKNGEASGGTGQALRIALDHDINIINLYFLEIAREYIELQLSTKIGEKQ